MASILKEKNARELTPEDRRLGKRFLWNAHSGARARARNLKRLRQAALREQRDGCDWLTETQALPTTGAQPAAFE
jgi:hypothetical protein